MPYSSIVFYQPNRHGGSIFLLWSHLTVTKLILHIILQVLCRITEYWLSLILLTEPGLWMLKTIPKAIRRFFREILLVTFLILLKGSLKCIRIIHFCVIEKVSVFLDKNVWLMLMASNFDIYHFRLRFPSRRFNTIFGWKSLLLMLGKYFILLFRSRHLLITMNFSISILLISNCRGAAFLAQVSSLISARLTRWLLTILCVR